MERALVTGGGGFIGSNLVRALLAEGYTVRVLENFSTGREENLADVMNDIELIDDPEGIQSEKNCAQAMKNVSYVLHEAAIPSVPRSIENPILTDRVNVGGTLTLLEAAKNVKIKRFVFASSSSVYGDTPGDIRCEDAVLKPLSPYAASKQAGETYAFLFNKLYGLPTVSLRYFNVFGPHQDPNSQYAAVVPIFVRHLLSQKSPTIFGDGEQSRDFTFIDNVIFGNLLAMKSEKICGEVFNIATNTKYSVNELFQQLCKITGINEIEPIYKPPRPGDVRNSLADVSKAQKLLGYKVQVPFDEGLRRTVSWHKQSIKTGK